MNTWSLYATSIIYGPSTIVDVGSGTGLNKAKYIEFDPSFPYLYIPVPDGS